jgi:hypothetical protein
LKLITFNDKSLDKNNLGSFIRTIGKNIYTFRDGKMILKTQTRKTKFLSDIKENKNIINKFITLDIETRDIKNKKVPYCICTFDGFNVNSF